MRERVQRSDRTLRSNSYVPTGELSLRCWSIDGEPSKFFCGSVFMG
ncbi:hypothetical protein [Chroococcidiopsis sp. CCNUC1]|nr:hypothetical protein [Chroococcidiopsis sp. CCNUC1]URD53723.1 hypothetical protein M5J74_32005 [Chroococcidiopsis sp. CCNUC1]